ncbi:MAG: response regulator [Planctomycetes bacterium]|nr:response regulator [Planctomycetota bacterium]
MFARAVRRRRTYATRYICTALGCQPILLVLYFNRASPYLFLIRRVIVAHSCDGKSVLIVDDDPEILQAIKLAFEDIGAKIETAADGNTAIDLAINHKPDLVVLDAMLPKRSGFLVLEKLKSAKQENKFRIIMITGNQGTRHKTWAESLGVDDYINKPFSMDTLLDKADKLLSN